MIIDHLWAQQPGKFFCLATKSASGKWQEHFFARRHIRRISAFMREHEDRDIYFCPHGFSEEKRRKEKAALPSILWADLDEVDPREIDIKPTIAIESSPGRFVGLWLTDKRVNEDLNRRLTYHLGADRGGWDVTQVLRVPGTRNYKYSTNPKVRLLWDDGPTYTIKQLEKLLPEPEEQDMGDLDAQEVYRDYQKKLPPWVRRELLREDNPPSGKRSGMLWKLEHALLTAGMTEDEAFVVIKASKWNKFAGRHSEDEQLRRELQKVIDDRMNARANGRLVDEDEEEDPTVHKFLMRPLSEVEEENIDWIWFPYLAKGELTILEGDPGLGKSYMAQMVSGALIDGRPLPSVSPRKIPAGRVAYFDIENSTGTVTKKRMSWNNVENTHNFFQDEHPFSVDDDETWDAMLDAIERLRPLLIVFDTINTYMGGADTYKASEVTQRLVKFKQLAARFNCSVLVLRHLTKGGKDKALYRGQGSIAFAGMARVVISMGVVPDSDDQLAIAVSKINVAKKPPALTFDIVETNAKTHASRFEWGDFIDLSAEQLVNSTPDKEKKVDQKAEAKSWLESELKDGPVEVDRLKRKAEAMSISERTLQRAASELNVERRTSGFGSRKCSTWELPD
jgi:hypothetical protein